MFPVVLALLFVPFHAYPFAHALWLPTAPAEALDALHPVIVAPYCHCPEYVALLAG